MPTKIELSKTREFGEIINDTFAFIGQNWKPLLKSYAIICGFFVIVSLVVAILQQYKMIGAIQTSTYPTQFARFSSMFGPTYFLSLIFTFLTLTAITLLPLCYLSLYKEKGNTSPSTEETWNYFKYFFFRIFGSNIVIGVCLFISILLCVVPFFYLLPILSLILPIMVIENAGLGYGWSRSFQLIKDDFWQTFGAIFLMWIITYALMTIFVLPVSLFSVGSILISKSQPSFTALVLTTVISAICQVFLMLPAITAALCYFNLQEQKEGTGLLGRINNFGNENPETNLPEEDY